MGLISQGLAADEPKSTGLEAYIKRLGYDSVTFKQSVAGKFLLNGELAGRKRVFFLDNYLGWTTLDTRCANGLKTLSELNVKVDDPFFGRITNSSLVLVDKLVIGRAQLVNQAVRVSKLGVEYMGVEFDAVLGRDFFLRNFCLLDCAGQRLYVRSRKPSKEISAALEESLRKSGFAEVSMGGNQGFTVDARINDGTVVLLVNIGIPFTVLDESQAGRLGFVVEKWGRFVPRSMDFLQKFKLSELKSLQIGQRRWVDTLVGAANLKAGGFVSGECDPSVQGVIGAEMLANKNAVIDFAGGKLWFYPEKKASQ